MPFRSCLALLILFCACEIPADIEVSDKYAPKLVVNSFFTPDSIWSVRLSKSVALNEPALTSDLFIRDANITIQGESGYQETLVHVGNGEFRSELGIRPIEGELYTINATSAQLSSVQSTSLSPKLQSAFLEIAVLDSNRFGQKQYQLKFSVTDLPKKSYYRLELQQVLPLCQEKIGSTIYTSVYDHPDGVPDYYSLYFDSSDPSFYHDASLLDEPPNALSFDADVPFDTPYFSDRLFENSVREFEIYFQSYRLETEIPHRFRLIVSALSHEQVFHDRSLILQDEYLFSGDPLFNTPINLYSNVEGGLGIFAGYSNNTYRIDFAGNPWNENDVGIREQPFPSCE